MRRLQLRSADVVFLKQFVRKGQKSARALKRANILLSLDKGDTGECIATRLHVNRDTVYNIKKRYLEEGLEAALSEKQRSGQPTKYGVKKRAEIIALACTDPPEGRKRWSVRLLAEELSKQEGFPTLNRETIRLTLKKAGQNRG